MNGSMQMTACGAWPSARTLLLNAGPMSMLTASIWASSPPTLLRSSRRDRRHDAASSVVFCEPCTDLRPGGERQLGQNVFDVRLGGGLAHDQCVRDCCV